MTGDGIVNILDIISLVNIITSEDLPNDDELCSADINSDGIVNILDIIALINYIIS